MPKKFQWLHQYPELARQYHSDNVVPLKDVKSGSNLKAKWFCSDGHKTYFWFAKVQDRVKNAHNLKPCLMCRSLAKLYPYVSKTLAPGQENPWLISAGTKAKYEWLCPVPSHSNYFMACHDRINDHGCPACGKDKLQKVIKQARKGNSVADHPQVSDWDWKANKEDPSAVAAGSTSKKNWVCPINKKHKWQATPNNRIGKNSGCPYCCGRISLREESFPFTHAEVYKSFRKEDNAGIDPFCFSSRSGQIVNWHCAKHKHDYSLSISMACKGRGCPICYGLGSAVTPKLRHLAGVLADTQSLMDQVTVWQLAKSLGIANTLGKCRLAVRAFAQKKFPPSELRKFAQSKPSKVDAYIEKEEERIAAGGKKNENDFSVSGKEASQKLAEKAVVKEQEAEEPKQILSAYDKFDYSGLDDAEELENRMYESAKRHLWQRIYDDENKAVEEIEQFPAARKKLKQDILGEYAAVKRAKMPAGYSMKFMPNIMQRQIALDVENNNTWGNFSGMGSGKTMSAVLASRNPKFKDSLTIIVCPNETVRREFGLVIMRAFPKSTVIDNDVSKLKSISGYTYLMLDYYAFQHASMDEKIKKILKQSVGFIIADELHLAKQRTKNEISTRRAKMLDLRVKAQKKNKDLHVLAMTGTPSINEVYETRSMLEWIHGKELPHLIAKNNTNDAGEVYRELCKVGRRWLPKYDAQLNEHSVRIDSADVLEDLLELPKFTPYQVDKVLTEARLPHIVKLCNKRRKTIVYTYFTDQVVDMIAEALEKKGHIIARFTGEDDKQVELQNFIEGDATVLIASQCITNGIDGLQKVCDRLVFNIPPWTDAELLQIIARLRRQGNFSSKVDVYYLQTFGEGWSWDDYRLRLLAEKRTMANCAVDGIMPDESGSFTKDTKGFRRQLEDLALTQKVA